jgi:copper oxidase (laccase) domain-containing protein
VTNLNRDTVTDEEYFFSYRRKTLRGEPDYGRQLSAVMVEA